jgi:hypothetical protein
MSARMLPNLLMRKSWCNASNATFIMLNAFGAVEKHASNSMSLANNPFFQDGVAPEKDPAGRMSNDGSFPSAQFEEWLGIVSAPGYEVSSLGRFRRGLKEVKGTPSANGYRHIGLTVGGKQKWFLAHRLVAEVFLSNKEGHPVVNHKDGDRLNNSVVNLEWSSRSHNAKHAWALKRAA